MDPPVAFKRNLATVHTGAPTTGNFAREDMA